MTNSCKRAVLADAVNKAVSVNTASSFCYGSRFISTQGHDRILYEGV
ncbi:hypothetical protein [Domibacillus robiginosus]|nr:hypothetical protein [Domibacillus robiginosus]